MVSGLLGELNDGRWCPEQESNLHLDLRRVVFYPLNYRGLGGGIGVGYFRAWIAFNLGHCIASLG